MHQRMCKRLYCNETKTNDGNCLHLAFKKHRGLDTHGLFNSFVFGHSYRFVESLTKLLEALQCIVSDGRFLFFYPCKVNGRAENGKRKTENVHILTNMCCCFGLRKYNRECNERFPDKNDGHCTLQYKCCFFFCVYFMCETQCEKVLLILWPFNGIEPCNQEMDRKSLHSASIFSSQQSQKLIRKKERKKESVFR